MIAILILYFILVVFVSCLLGYDPWYEKWSLKESLIYFLLIVGSMLILASLTFLFMFALSAAHAVN